MTLAPSHQHWYSVEVPVSLQISVAPPDLPHARWTLPHQLRQWGGQVDEVLFMLDAGPGAPDNGQRAELEQLLAELCDEHAHARVEHVDYGAGAASAVATRFLGGRKPPLKDCYGKAVYPYLFGLHAARHRFVLHLDSDMLFGGGSQGWIAEAHELLTSRADVFSTSPLPGPPSDRPFSRRVAAGHAGSARRKDLRENGVQLSSGAPGPRALRFARISTRDFMIDRDAFDEGEVILRSWRPSARNLVAAGSKRALTRRNFRYAPAEEAISRAMAGRGMIRVDFLGSSPGMWSLHPPLRTAAFYSALPELVRRIESGDVPDGQRGDFDLNEALWR